MIFMKLCQSAHVDTFCRDNLPPADQWPEFLFDLPDVQYPDQLNCATELLTVATTDPDRRCLTSQGGEKWTYGQLFANANKVANYLTGEKGLVPGNRVLLRGPNTPWLAAIWFGAVKAGLVVVTTIAILRSSELEVLEDVAQHNASLVDHRFMEDVPGSFNAIVYGDEAWEMLMAGQSDQFEDVATSRDDVMMLAFTSGTTGRPKATMHFHQDVMAICDTFSKHILQPSSDDVFMGSPPFGFTFGLGGDLLFPLHVGASAVLIERATPLQFADLVDKYGVTTAFTAPTAYKVMIKNQRRMPSLKAAVSAGEHLPQATWEDFHDLTGIRIIDGIGATEMLHIFIGSSGDAIRPGSTGQTVPGYIACIVDDEGNEVPHGQPGRLAVKGPTGCRYLYGDRQGKYVQNGWNITGDTFVADEDGYYWYRARNDDMIISSGYNIAAPEVEEAIMKHPAVRECAVVGVPDDDRGTVVKAYVVTDPDQNLEAKVLQDFVKQQIAPYKYPRLVEFLDELPRTATGKLQRFKLRTTA